MQFVHYIDTALEAVGALGLLCGALSKLPLGKASTVLSHLGTNFLAAAKAAREKKPTTHITIPKGEP